MEYKVVPAPKKGQKKRGVKAADERYALALAEVINAEAARGWRYVRAESLPVEEKTGWTRRETVYHTLLIFERGALPVVEATGAEGRPAQAAAPAEPVAEPASAPAPAPAPQPAPQPQPQPASNPFAPSSRRHQQEPPISRPAAEPQREGQGIADGGTVFGAPLPPRDPNRRL